MLCVLGLSLAACSPTCPLHGFTCCLERSTYAAVPVRACGAGTAPEEGDPACIEQMSSQHAVVKEVSRHGTDGILIISILAQAKALACPWP